MGLLDSLEIDHLDDTGMYVWAGILTIVSLAMSLGVAIWWQKRKEKQKAEAP